MTLFVIGDSWPSTVPESVYVTAVLCFGVILQGFLVGNIMSVTATDSYVLEVSEITDQLQYFLREQKVDETLVTRAYNLLNNMITDRVQLLVEETNFVTELPHSLQISYYETTRMKFLGNCPLFDFCTPAVMRSLCLSMNLRVYGAGDVIIYAGDIGYEMYFISEGEVEVCNAAETVVYTTLTSGQFFGETSLVFKSERSATIKAKSFCLIYVLSKTALEAALRGCDFNAEMTVQSLKTLQDINKWRNSAVTANLKAAADPTSKLSRTLRPFEDTRSASLQQLFNLFSPKTTFRAVFDCIGLFALCFYAFVAPYVFAFSDEALESSITAFDIFSYILDLFCLVEFILRLWMIHLSGKFHLPCPWSTDKWSIIFDGIGILPVDLIVLSPKVPYRFVYCLRLVRIFRTININERFDQVLTLI
jgi:CRP-like cAMP-binding protein